MGREAVAVVEGLVLTVGAEELSIDRLRGQAGSQGSITARESLRAAEEVRDDPLVHAGEEFACAAEAGHHLIEYQINLLLIAEAAQLPQHPDGPRRHAVHTLNNRLDYHARHCPQKLRRQGTQVLHTAHVSHLHPEALEAVEESTDTTQGGRTHRIPVITI